MLAEIPLEDDAPFGQVGGKSAPSLLFHAEEFRRCS
jgi:hypothetical protein